MSIIPREVSSVLIALTFACLAVPSLSGCDTSDQIIEWKPAGTLGITSASSTSPAAVTVPDTVSYYVENYTIDRNYKWTLEGGEGGEIVKTRNEEEFVDVAFRDPGTYTIKVDDGEYTGTLEVVASESEGE